MRLLVVGSLLPAAEPSSGFDIATRAIADGLARLGADVSFLGFRLPGAPPPAIGRARLVDLGTREIENASAGAVRKAAWAGGALLRGLPVSAAKLAAGGAGARVRRAIEAAGPFDALVLNSVQMPAAFPFLSRLGPFLYVAHNVEHVSARENARSGGSALRRILFRREAGLVERVERDLAARAAGLLALTEDDRRALAGDGRRALVLPLTVGRGAPPADAGVRERDVGLLGTWSWAPNRVGLDWFVAEIVPRLAPDVSVEIAGRFDGAPPAAPPNVRFVGRVPDAGRFVRGARVLALPTIGGTGIQLKTVEALEEGMPAVATRAALRGIAAPPANLRIADDPEAFARALGELVAAERGGAPLRLSGAAFAAGQRAGLDAALARALGWLAEAPPSKAAPSKAAPSKAAL